MSGLTNVDALFLGAEFACAKHLDGSYSCWGNNAYGQLGDSTSIQRLTPVPVTVASGMSTLSLGSFHSCSLMPNQTVQCWGANADLQLGDEIGINSLTPVAVVGLSGATAVQNFARHTCAVTDKQELIAGAKEFTINLVWAAAHGSVEPRSFRSRASLR